MSPLIMQQALAMGCLTQVQLLWIEKRVETWIRFGHVAREQIIDVTRRVVSFAPNSVFAVVHWAANDYGTILSQIDILRAVMPGEPYVAVSDVQPGADILLHVSRWPKVQKVLQVMMRSRPSPSIRPRSRPSISGMSTIACPSTTSPGPTR